MTRATLHTIATIFADTVLSRACMLLTVGLLAAWSLAVCVFAFIPASTTEHVLLLRILFGLHGVGMLLTLGANILTHIEGERAQTTVSRQDVADQTSSVRESRGFNAD